MKGSCGTCKWWDFSADLKERTGLTVGRCRIRAPQRTHEFMISPTVAHTTPWPIVGNGDWCGEHEPQEQQS